MNTRDMVSIKEYIDAKFDAIEKETSLAHYNLEKRLDGMNEFRQTLRDANDNFITRKEHEFVQADVRELRESRAELVGKASQNSVNLSYLISIIALILAILRFLIK